MDILRIPHMFGFDGYGWISVLFCGIAVAIVLVLRYLGRNDDYWKKRGVPYAPRISFMSLLRITLTKPIPDMLREVYRKYGRLYGKFKFSSPVLVVSDPALLKDVLVKDFHIFPYRRNLNMGDPMLDTMLSNVKGEDWKRIRTVITPAFTSKRMRQMGSIINDCSKSVLETCEKHFREGEPMNCKATFSAFTMDVIASSAFGTKIDSHNDPKNIFVQRAKQLVGLFISVRFIINMVIPIWFLKSLGLESYKTTDFFKDVSLQVISERKHKGGRYNDVLQILMDAADENTQALNSDLNEDEEDRFGSIIHKAISQPLNYKNLSETELLSQCVLFFFVGYETSASTLAYMAYSLALNPEWQEKLISEVDEAFRKHKEMSHDSVLGMKILDAVVSETLRIYPFVLSLERTAIEDYKLGDTGITVEKGTRIQIPIYAMHHDSEFFEEPQKFNPNRFMDPSQPSHPPYTYLPFGAGPRNCLGMRFALLEIKLCMANVLRHYRFRKHSSTKVPLEFNKGSGFLTVNSLPLSVEKRSNL